MATEPITCFFYRNYDGAEHSSSGDYHLVRGAGRDVNDVSVDKILRLFIPNAASLCSAVAEQFYHLPLSPK